MFRATGEGPLADHPVGCLIRILSLRHDVNFSVAQAAMEAFGDCIKMKRDPRLPLG
ncbi:Dyp-type peroxidase domain-containing protein [Escherichia coli]